MALHNYKKNKLEQLKGFCAVVEYGNIVDAGKRLNISASSISSQILSLEQDIGILLFNRIKNKLVLNQNGKERYKEAKYILSCFDSFYKNSKKTRIGKRDIFLLKLKRFYNLRKHYFVKKIRRLVLSSIKYFFILLIFSLFCGCYYLYQANYFFDKKLYSLASPSLKQLIKDGNITIFQDRVCSFGIVQTNLDIYDLLLKLTEIKQYKDLSVTLFILTSNPLVSMRFTGDENIDKVFKDKKLFPCNSEKTYLATAKFLSNAKELFTRDKNFRIYTLYYEPLDTCLNCSYLLENIKKYPDNLFGIHIEKPVGMQNSRGLIIKHGRYYYLMATTISVSADKGVHETFDRTICWKKLTEDELIQYNGGLYWKMIKDYNIRI